MEFFGRILNKTAGYHRYIFRPPILLTMPFKRMQTFSFQKSTLSLFSNFSKLKKFVFFQRTSQRLKRNVQEIISIDTHSPAKLPPLQILEKFKLAFEKKTSIFSRNPNFVCFEKFCYFSRILRQIYNDLVIENFTFRIVILPDTDFRMTLSIGK